MIGPRVVIAVASLRLAAAVQIGRVGVDQLVARKRELGQEAVTAAVHQFHLVLAAERRDGQSAAIDADVCRAGGLRCMIAPPPRWVSM